MENEIINFENKNFKKSEFISLFESIYEHSNWVIKNVIEGGSSNPNTMIELKSAMKRQNLGYRGKKSRILNFTGGTGTNTH